jgi:hypothetical protein
MKDQKNKHKPYYVLEWVWLASTLICAFLGVFILIKGVYPNKYVFFIFSALSLLMYLMRRHMRKNNMYK